MSSIVHTIRLVTSAKEAIAEIGKYEDKIVATAQTVEKHAATLGGNKMLQQASNWTAAIAKLGGATGQLASTEQILAGASKLTASEKEKVNKIVTTAIEKYTALGQVAPRAMLDLADATKKAEAPTESWGGKVGKVWDTVKGFAGTLGIGLGISALIGFAKSAFEAAGSLGDLASKLGASVEFTQRMSYVAGQSGTTIDTFGTAISKMNVLLSEGDASTIESLKKAGLSFAEIRAMRPEDAFLAISDAIAKVPDPMRQAELAVKLFGKSGQDLLPAIKDGIRDVGDQAAVMSDQTALRLKQAGDDWERFKNRVLVSGAGVMATVLDINDVMDDFQSITFAALFGSGEDVVKLAKKWGPGFGEMSKHVKDLRAQLSDGLSPALRDALDVDAEFTLANKKNAEQIQKNIAVTEAYTAKIRGLADAYTGKSLQREINDTAAAIAKANKEGGVQIAQIPQLVTRINEWRAAGMTIPPVLTDIAAKFQHLFILPASGDGVKGFFSELKVRLDDLDEKLPTIDLSSKVTLDPVKFIKSLNLPKLATGVKVPAKTFSESFSGYLQKSLPVDIMSAITGGGSKIQAIGSSIGGFLASENGLGKSLTKGLTGLFGKGLGGALASALPGIGAMVGPAVDALFGKLFGSKGRDAVNAFAGKFGGLNELHALMGQKLPQDAERLWIALTQGVGKNNPEQAARIIAEIEAAFARADETAEQLLERIDQAGGVIDASMVPALLRMADAGQLSAAAMRKLMGLAEETTLDWKAMQDAAARYNIEESKLGKGFQQARLNDVFAEYAADFELFRSGSADMGEVINKMAPKVSAAVQEALKYGTQIPATMKPMLEALAKAGQLVGENGEKLTDLSTLNFAVPIEESMKDLVKLFKEFLETLKKTREGILAIPTDIDVDLRFHGGNAAAAAETAATASRGGLVTNRGVQYLAEGGLARAQARILQFRPRGTDTVPAMLTPGEGVLSRRGMAALANLNQGVSPGGATGASVNVTVVVTAWDGASVDTWLRNGGDRKLARAVLPQLPDAAGSYGIKRRA